MTQENLNKFLNLYKSLELAAEEIKEISKDEDKLNQDMDVAIISACRTVQSIVAIKIGLNSTEENEPSVN